MIEPAYNCRKDPNQSGSIIDHLDPFWLRYFQYHIVSVPHPDEFLDPNYKAKIKYDAVTYGFGDSAHFYWCDPDGYDLQCVRNLRAGEKYGIVALYYRCENGFDRYIWAKSEPYTGNSSEAFRKRKEEEYRIKYLSGFKPETPFKRDLSGDLLEW